MQLALDHCRYQPPGGHVKVHRSGRWVRYGTAAKLPFLNNASGLYAMLVSVFLGFLASKLLHPAGLTRSHARQSARKRGLICGRDKEYDAHTMLFL